MFMRRSPAMTQPVRPAARPTERAGESPRLLMDSTDSRPGGTGSVANVDSERAIGVASWWNTSGRRATRVRSIAPEPAVSLTQHVSSVFVSLSPYTHELGASDIWGQLRCSPR